MTASYLAEFQPTPRLLLGPGPSSVHPRVLRAMTTPVLGHLDPDFFQAMNDIGDMLRQVYRTANAITMPVSATGTGAMETACVNLLEPGDVMVVCRNGYFGARLGRHRPPLRGIGLYRRHPLGPAGGSAGAGG